MKPNTERMYNSDCFQFASFIIQQTTWTDPKLGKPDSHDILAFARYLKANNYSNNTICRKVSAVSNVHNIQLNFQPHKEFPTEEIQITIPKDSAQQILKQEEIKNMLHLSVLACILKSNMRAKEIKKYLKTEISTRQINRIVHFYAAKVGIKGKKLITQLRKIYENG